jgi:hypothetical protein
MCPFFTSAGPADLPGRPPRLAPDLVGPGLSWPYHLPARIQSFQGVAAPFPGRPTAPSGVPGGTPRLKAAFAFGRAPGSFKHASRTRPGAQKAPKIASNSFHLWQRIGTYQMVARDSRAKFFSSPLLQASRRVLRSDRSVADDRGGRRGSPEPDNSAVSFTKAS